MKTTTITYEYNADGLLIRQTITEEDAPASVPTADDPADRYNNLFFEGEALTSAAQPSLHYLRTLRRHRPTKDV